MPGKKRPIAAVAEEEEAFPRGGGYGLAPIVQRQIKEDAYKEAEADFDTQDAKKKRRKKRPKYADDEDDGDQEDAFFRTLIAHDKLPKFVELLKFKNVHLGTKLWGTLTDITSKELIISLPHGLRGHVAYEAASDVLEGKSVLSSTALDTSSTKSASRLKKAKTQQSDLPALTDLFTVGQLVRCVVTGVHSGDTDAPSGAKHRKRLDLTLHVAQVNSGIGAEALKPGAVIPACLRSVEDHGYMMDLGVAGATGFLPKGEAGASGLREGALLEVAVRETKSRGSTLHVTVTAVPTIVATTVTKEWEGVTIGSLLPGALVSAKVQHVLSDGLVVSFLTFFTGTIDPFHLGSDAHLREKASDWKTAFSKNQRLKARILYVDPESKRVGLTLLRHLVDGALPPGMFPPMGKVFGAGMVRRVDPGLGLLVQLGESNQQQENEHKKEGTSDKFIIQLGYAHISNLSDQKIDDIGSRYRPGQIVRARVVGARPMDGLAALSLRPSVVEQDVMNVADVKAGMKIAACIVRVEKEMLLVQIASHLRAIVPALHMSDVVSDKSHRKFKEGQKVSGRVLSVSPETKKVTVTLKPAMVGSSLPIVSNAQALVPGSRTHGVITGVQEYGVFLTFYNGVAGLVPLEECGLPEGQTPSQAFSVGQVVKCRILGVDHKKKHRIRLSLLSKKQAAKAVAATDMLGGLQQGQIVCGVVKKVHKNDEDILQYAEIALYLEAVEIGTNDSPLAVGRLEAAHLADHPLAAAALAEVLAVGTHLQGLLVLQRLEAARELRVTRKSSLLKSIAAGGLPEAITDLREGATYPGYIASVTSEGVYVRFLGDLTGRVGLSQLSDTFVADPHASFVPGMSVRAQVIQCDTDKNRCTLTLKRSLCGGAADAFISSYFMDMELAAALGEEEGSSTFDWASTFAIGSKVEGQVHGTRDYGVLCDMEAHPDVVGLAAPNQLPPGTALGDGTPIQAIVLDYSRKDGIVDLSLRADVLSRAEESNGAAAVPPVKRRRSARNKVKPAEEEEENAVPPSIKALEHGSEVSVTVELSKPDEGYCVVSLPVNVEGTTPWLGVLATSDFAQPPTAAAALQPRPGESVRAVVAALPGPETMGRLVFVQGDTGAKGANKTGNGPRDFAGAQRRPRLSAGTKTSGRINAVHALHADVTLECGTRGRIHITNVVDAEDAIAENPLMSLETGSSLDLVVLGRMQSPEGRRHGLLELSCRPSLLASAAPGGPTPRSAVDWQSLAVGQTHVLGFIQEISREFVWVLYSPTVRGRAFLPTACRTLEDCMTAASQPRFRSGTPARTTVVAVDAQKRSLDVSIESEDSSKAPELKPGVTILGTVVAVGGTGIKIQIGSVAFARVALTDVHDVPVDNALEGLTPGEFVRVRLLEEQAEGIWAASLRPSRGAACAVHDSKRILASKTATPKVTAPPESLNLTDLTPGTRVVGYVKSAGKAGVFVSLSRDVDARIKLRQLSDEFIEDPVKAFSPGALIEATVVSSEGGKVELTLRTKSVPPSLASLKEGQIVRGRVKRVEKYGVFVQLDGPGAPCGMAHVSELTDGYVKDIATLFKSGQEVTARVLVVDNKAGRLSLGLKPSYLADVGQEFGDQGSEEEPDFDEELETAAAMHVDELGKDSDDDNGEEGEEEDSEYDLDDDLAEQE